MNAFKQSLSDLANCGRSTWQGENVNLLTSCTRNKNLQSEENFTADARCLDALKLAFEQKFNQKLADNTTLVLRTNPRRYSKQPCSMFPEVLEAIDAMAKPDTDEFLSLLSCCLTEKNPQAVEALPLLLFCDGAKNKQKTFFIHVHQRNSNSSSFEYEIETLSISNQKHESALSATYIHRVGNRLVFQPHLFDQFGCLPNEFHLSTTSFSKYLLFKSTYVLGNKYNKDSQKSFITIDVCTSEVCLCWFFIEFLR